MRLVEKILTIIQGSFEFFLGIIEDSLKKFPEKIPWKYPWNLIEDGVKKSINLKSFFEGLGRGFQDYHFFEILVYSGTSQKLILK